MALNQSNEQCKFCHGIFVKKYTNHKFCSLTCANRFNLNNKRTVKLPGFSVKLAELFGIILGDGSVSKYFSVIYLNSIVDRGYVGYVSGLCESLFPGASVTVRRDTPKGTSDIQISSRDVSEYLKKIGFHTQRSAIPNWIANNKQRSTWCMRGLFDTEGSVGIKYFKGKRGSYMYKQLTFTNYNPVILNFVEGNLKDLGYKPTTKSTKNIYISNRKDIEKFTRDVGSSNPKIIEKLNCQEINNFVWTGGGKSKV